jgi:hypothetical protein
MSGVGVSGGAAGPAAFASSIGGILATIDTSCFEGG